MTCSGSPGLVAVGSEVNPGSPSSVSQLPCACCPSEPGQSGPVGWGGTPRRGPTTNGRLPCSLALGGTLRSVGGHMGVVRELQGRDLSGPGVARLLQKWDPEPHPGAPSPGAKQHRSGRGGGGVGFGAGCGGALHAAGAPFPHFSARLASLCRGDHRTPAHGRGPALLGHTGYNVISRASRIARKPSALRICGSPRGISTPCLSHLQPRDLGLVPEPLWASVFSSVKWGAATSPWGEGKGSTAMWVNREAEPPRSSRLEHAAPGERRGRAACRSGLRLQARGA